MAAPGLPGGDQCLIEERCVLLGEERFGGGFAASVGG